MREKVINNCFSFLNDLGEIHIRLNKGTGICLRTRENHNQRYTKQDSVGGNTNCGEINVRI